MAEPIEIIIRKGSGGEGTGFGIPSASPSGFSPEGRDTNFGKEMSNFLKNGQSGDKMMAMTTALALSSLKKSINYGISQYGNITGNYIQQAQAQYTFGIVSSIAQMGVTTAMAGALNPALGVASAIVQVAGKTIDWGMQVNQLITSVTKLNTYANLMQERSGNSYNNGSRGTDY